MPALEDFEGVPQDLRDPGLVGEISFLARFQKPACPP